MSEPDDDLIAQRINERRQRGVIMPVENGLHTGALKTGTPTGVHAAEQAEFGEDFSGKRGLSGLIGAVRQIAHEVSERMLGSLRITGDNTIGVKGSGRTWAIHFKTPLQMPPVGGGRTPQVITPWQPIPAATANKVIVEPFSTLLGTDLTNYTVASLTSEFTLAINQYLYLEMAYTAFGELDTVTLKGGAAWTGYPNPVETDGADTLADPLIVTFTRFLIAYTKATTNASFPAGCMSLDDSGTALKVIRCVFTPLQLVLTTRAGLSFEYPAATGRIP